MTMQQQMPIAMIGFGEAGQAFAKGWGPEICARVACHDLKLDGPETAGPIRAAAAERGVRATDRAGALAGAGAVFCLVTADQAIAAARQAAPHLAPGTFWLDGNSCAPDSKRAAAEIVAAAGGRYVDVAVMAPVHPKLHRTPLLVSGPGAAAAEPLLSGLGMVAQRLDDRVGSASTVKMLRSVMVKGIEALTAECFLAATRAGVAADVLASLHASNPEADWPARAAYNLERMMEHGTRRAAEMREVAATLDALGMPSAVTAAVADWHDRIGALGLKGRDGGLDARARSILGLL